MGREYVDKSIDFRLIERYPAKLLLEVCAGKAKRRLLRSFGKNILPERAVTYNGIVVFDTQLLHGEGITVGADYLRALLQLGFKRTENVFELCAGPGYIGYSLLANGFCDKITLADINPSAVEMAKRTAAHNKIEDKVNIYHSDVLASIPETEKWDLVVSNPPHFLPESAKDTNIKAFDPDWNIHKRFYSQVKRFMKPGGHVVLMENGFGSTEDIFIPMIEENGGKYITSHKEQDVCGHSNGMYYMVSQW